MTRHAMNRILLPACAAAALLLSAAPVFAACTTPTGAAGDQIYNTTYDVMQYCNGTNWVNMGSSGNPGGVNAGTQYQLGYYAATGSTMSGVAAITTNAHNILSVAGSSVTASDPVLSLTQTWNSGGIAFTGIKEVITDTASAAGSLLLDLETAAGGTKFAVNKSGVITTLGGLTLTGDATASGSTATTVVKVNGIAYASTAAVDTVPVITTANTTSTYTAVPNCQDSSGNHLNYNTTTHAFSCGTSSSGGGGLTVGTTAIGSGTTTRVLYDNAGALDEYTISGTGNVAMTTSPTFATSVTDPLLIGGTGTTSTLALRSTSGTGAAGADIIFQTGTNGATEAMRILNSGYVGIGTTSPQVVLDVLGVQRLVTTSSAPTFPSTSKGIEMVYRGDSPYDTGFIQTYDRTGAAYKPLRIEASTLALNAGSAGSVGIGTTSPPAGPKLYITNGASTRSVVTISDGNTASVMLAGGASTNGVLASDSGLTFRTGATYTAPDSGGTTVMTLNTSGNVGIGTTPNASYTLTTVGNILSTGYFLSSDARLKHDIVPFDRKGLAVIEGIKTVHFKWNKDNRADYGVIAQDVQKVLPEAVNEDAKGFLAVQYEKLVLPVIDAVKELHAMVTNLAARADGHDEKLADLEKQLTVLKTEFDAYKKAHP